VSEDTAFDSWIALGTELGKVREHFGDYDKGFGQWCKARDNFGVTRQWLHRTRVAAEYLLSTQWTVEPPRDINELYNAAMRAENGDTDQWYTPRWLFAQIGVMFDIDVAAPTNPAHRTVPAHRYYTETDDGLAQPWHGLIWCNPPYSDAAPWAARWIDHGNGLLLTHIPANAGWAVDIWRHADAAIWLQALHFERPDGQTYRPGYALMLSAIGQAVTLLDRVDAPKSGAVWRRG
jgi:hypothetical protein